MCGSLVRGVLCGVFARGVLCGVGGGVVGCLRVRGGLREACGSFGLGEPVTSLRPGEVLQPLVTVGREVVDPLGRALPGLSEPADAGQDAVGVGAGRVGRVIEAVDCRTDGLDENECEVTLGLPGCGLASAFARSCALGRGPDSTEFGDAGVDVDRAGVSVLGQPGVAGVGVGHLRAGVRWVGLGVHGLGRGAAGVVLLGPGLADLVIPQLADEVVRILHQCGAGTLVVGLPRVTLEYGALGGFLVAGDVNLEVSVLENEAEQVARVLHFVGRDLGRGELAVLAGDPDLQILGREPALRAARKARGCCCVRPWVRGVTFCLGDVDPGLVLTGALNDG